MDWESKTAHRNSLQVKDIDMVCTESFRVCTVLLVLFTYGGCTSGDNIDSQVHSSSERPKRDCLSVGCKVMPLYTATTVEYDAGQKVLKLYDLSPSFSDAKASDLLGKTWIFPDDSLLADFAGSFALGTAGITKQNPRTFDALGAIDIVDVDSEGIVTTADETQPTRIEIYSISTPSGK